MTTETIDYEYGVRVRDERTSQHRVDLRPTLAMAQHSRNLVREAYAAGDTYSADAEVVIRPVAMDGRATEWMALTDEEIAEIQGEAYEALNAAFMPVLAAGMTQLAKGN